MISKELTVIVPAYNEAENLLSLIDRIARAMKKNSIRYSIVVVDDCSTDKTQEVLSSVAHRYPLTVLKKKSATFRGKARSLLAGFSYAKTRYVAMIDADLQYPPEAIPEMLEELKKGAYIVVSKREKRKIGVVRDTLSLIYRSFFGSLLFNMPYDIQSGLKVFRREILERINISPSNPWMFDLEFLLQARDAGYNIVSHNIMFSPRSAGKPKIHILSASLGMAVASFLLKLKETSIIPFHFREVKKKGEGFHYKGSEYIHFSTLPKEESAFKQLTRFQIGIILWFCLLLLLFFIINNTFALTVLVALLTFMYFLDLLFTGFLVSRSLKKDHEITIEEKEIKAKQDSFWPLYTIFCPLYKEWEVLPQFIRAMSQLDYPKNKLQVMLLLEEDDKSSIQHVKEIDLPSFFEVRIVPHSRPKTKPKALNYGLKFAKGEYAVIYDAEDIPDPLQLKKTYLAFTKSASNVVCIQAKLNFYNPHQNILTRIFTAEYSLWFDLVLPGLQSINAPIPLGGTSNHFRVSDLKQLKGWDAFNVTEDCDLGIRLAKKHYKTAIVDSTTMEEANSRIFNWFGQRSRWIKGYVQTYFVHTRNLHQFSHTLKNPDAFTFQLVVGGKILSMLINPFMWGITFSYFAFRSTFGSMIESFYPAPVLYMGVVCLIFGNFLYMYEYMIGCIKRGYFELVKYALITPVYWLAMSLAAWRALLEIIVRPHYWSKTIHGFHITSKKDKNRLNQQRHSFEHVLGVYSSPQSNTRNYGNLPDYCDILQQSYVVSS